LWVNDKKERRIDMKKKQSKVNLTQKKAIRLMKGHQWRTTYNGSPKKIMTSYKKKFHVDTLTAIRDLQELGVEFTQEYLEAVRTTEAAGIRKKQEERECKKQEEGDLMYDDSDDTFVFIAGYTDGGIPFGTTWEELGLEPYASPKEIEDAYENSISTEKYK
jgi:hypothetical protein